VTDLLQRPAAELLRLHAQIADELRARGVTRSFNNPTGDLAEFLFCHAFAWKQAGNSNANIDAIGPDGTRYQIKGRRITQTNGSRQLSALRDLAGGHFDFLGGVLFAADYTILRAVIIPRSVIEERAAFVERTNSHKFFLRDDIWDASGVSIGSIRHGRVRCSRPDVLRHDQAPGGHSLRTTGSGLRGWGWDCC